MSSFDDVADAYGEYDTLSPSSRRENALAADSYANFDALFTAKRAKKNKKKPIASLSSSSCSSSSSSSSSSSDDDDDDIHSIESDQSIVVFVGKDWNGEFQELLESLVKTKSGSADYARRWEDLYKLTSDFDHAAALFAKLIICEANLDERFKTVRPVPVGGFAGGAKWICQNILFKFIALSNGTRKDRERELEQSDGNSSGNNSSGGSESDRAGKSHRERRREARQLRRVEKERRQRALRSESDDRLKMLYGDDECAMKVAGHELRALIAIHGAVHMEPVLPIALPLMSVIDYKGFRVVAQSILPVHGKKTLVYGSSDGGLRVHTSFGSEHMRELARRLNLKAHLVNERGNASTATTATADDDQKRMIYACTDIEGHKGDDGRFYLYVNRTQPNCWPRSMDKY
jgi:Clustered mitochondria